MAWIRQHSWFVLAAFCLVGSLIMVWKTDVETPESVAAPRALPDQSRIVRSLQDLDHVGAFDSQAPSLLPRADGAATDEMVMLAPAGIPGRWATPMNTETRFVPRDQFTPAGFEQSESAAAVAPVWLSGTIEDAGDDIDGIRSLR